MEETLPGGPRYSVRSTEFYGLTVNVTSEPEKRATKVDSYAVSSFWNKSFEAMDAALREQVYKCP